MEYHSKQKGLKRTDSTKKTTAKKTTKRAELPPKEALKLSGGKSILHLGTVQNLVFRPTTNYLLHPEQYPVPKKQLKGRRIALMRARKVLPETAKVNAVSETPVHPLQDEKQSVSWALAQCRV